MKKPILTVLYRILGMLSFVGAACSITYGFIESRYFSVCLIYGAGLIIGGIVLFGIAEVVHLIAKIEFNTRESSHGYQMLKSLQAIAKNTSNVQVPE